MTEERRLQLTGTAGGILGYGLLYFVLWILILPAAWGSVSFVRWLARNSRLSDGTTLSFEGRAGEVWYWFAALGLLESGSVIAELIGLIHQSFWRSEAWFLLVSPALATIELVILRWYFKNLKLTSGEQLRFVGGFLPIWGWSLLCFFSVLTIIGWAWAQVGFLRWLCRNVDAGGGRVEFRASGFEMLWRTLVTILTSLFIIPIPFVSLWFYRWFLGNVVMRPAVENEVAGTDLA